MSDHTLAREELWDVAASQHGFVTAHQATELGVGKGALQMLVQRGTLDRVAFGVYRFPRYPVSEYDPCMLAVLWTRAPEACLSHETALDAYGVSDVNPNRLHVTVSKQRRLRRAGGEGYMIHHEDLTPERIAWWQEIPTVTPATAITQCTAFGTSSHLLRQAIVNGHAQGRITTVERDELTAALEARHDQ
ncbi:type IV toxin-antitoxin system AbiEi family antitoxin domain-containing protein [Frankia sp. CiP1_Cm_nod1]|uniref:type IV toxin-antitoxin system AbiEi family antitoxin domain-containing protein n=1 Tax=Frankia sp. CiP1_Cm_nod1 TaxID=2897160 RepID=UPI0020254521